MSVSLGEETFQSRGWSLASTERQSQQGAAHLIALSTLLRNHLKTEAHYWSPSRWLTLSVSLLSLCLSLDLDLYLAHEELEH